MKIYFHLVDFHHRELVVLLYFLVCHRMREQLEERYQADGPVLAYPKGRLLGGDGNHEAVVEISRSDSLLKSTVNCLTPIDARAHSWLQSVENRYPKGGHRGLSHFLLVEVN